MLEPIGTTQLPSLSYSRRTLPSADLAAMLIARHGALTGPGKAAALRMLRAANLSVCVRARSLLSTANVDKLARRKYWNLPQP